MYQSDPELANSLYHKTRTRYPQFKAGIFFLFCLAGGLIYDIYNAYEWIVFGCSIPNILLHVLIAVILAVVFVFAIRFMLSGGKKYLLGYEKEQCLLHKDHISLRYIQGKKKKCLVNLDIYYCDIQSLYYEEDKKRLKIISACQKQVIPALKKSDAEIKRTDTERAVVFIYAKYADFAKILTGLEKLSLKKIGSNSSLHP